MTSSLQAPCRSSQTNSNAICLGFNSTLEYDPDINLGYIFKLDSPTQTPTSDNTQPPGTRHQKGGGPFAWADTFIGPELPAGIIAAIVVPIVVVVAIIGVVVAIKLFKPKVQPFSERKAEHIKLDQANTDEEPKDGGSWRRTAPSLKWTTNRPVVSISYSDNRRVAVLVFNSHWLYNLFATELNYCNSKTLVMMIFRRLFVVVVVFFWKSPRFFVRAKNLTKSYDDTLGEAALPKDWRVKMGKARCCLSLGHMISHKPNIIQICLNIN